MTNEEAIKVLKYNKPISDPRLCGIELCDACDIAIEALEKQSHICSNCKYFFLTRTELMFVQKFIYALNIILLDMKMHFVQIGRIKMTKELFLDCIKKIQAYDEWEHKLYELGVNFWEREEVLNLYQSCINLLNYNCKDIPENKYDVSNIEYFIYDCEFGKKSDKYFVTEEDGTEYHWYTAEDLWNYLVMIHPEIEDKEEDCMESVSCNNCIYYPDKPPCDDCESYNNFIKG